MATLGYRHIRNVVERELIVRPKLMGDEISSLL